MKYDVPLVPQTTGMSCWAAGLAMIISWRDKRAVSPSEIASKLNYSTQYVTGLDPNDTKMLTAWGLVTEAPQTYTIKGFHSLLRDYGPLWVAAAVPGPHIRVVTGFDPRGDDPDASMVDINDPWARGMSQFRMPNKGSAYRESYRTFVMMNEALGAEEVASKQPAPIYVAHLPRS